jgi:outer membrane biosynthesis protein TonB
MYADEDRPPSLLHKRRIEPSVIALGALAAVGAHVLIPTALLASQWLLILLGLAVPVGERERTKPPMEIMAAEFVKLGKPFDPTKLPNRKVPPVVKRRPDGVAISRDAKEKPPEEEKKERPKEAQDSLLDNLVDRTKDFAEDVETEQEGDPNGIAEGTATQAKAGDIYQGQLKVFFQRGWTVPNVVQNMDKLVSKVAVKISSEGAVEGAEIFASSGDPLFDQSGIDAVNALMQASAKIPEPPPELAALYYGQTIVVQYRGSEAR